MFKSKISCLLICFLITTTLVPVFAVEANSKTLDKDINISLEAAIIRGSITGFSHARRIRFGTNIRMVNNANKSKDGSWELVYSDFSDIEIKSKKENFTLSLNDLLPYLQGIIYRIIS